MTNAFGGHHAGLALPFLGAAMGCALSASAATLSVTPATMPPIATVDPRYQSYNVEMAEVIGGNFWKPYDRQSHAAAKAQPAASNSSGAVPQIGQDPSMFMARPPVTFPTLACASWRRHSGRLMCG